MKTKHDHARPYVTKDGSVIRELFHPDRHGGGRMSLAEAVVPPGRETAPHSHLGSEELYHVLSGRGRMRLERREFELLPGDTVRIEPGQVHSVLNEGEEDLVFLCLCAPPYSHHDTELEEDAAG
ncbi:MAG: cupin domain-containing protein [Thermodesulfobacteriota bacterium]